jgi:hypothetical protein
LWLIGSLVAGVVLAACAPGPVSSGPGGGTTASLPASSSSSAPGATGSSPVSSVSASPQATPVVLHAGCPATSVTNKSSARQRSLVAATTNWSGYVARSSKSFSCVQGSWTQPNPSCPVNGNTSLAIWIGFDGETGPSRATLEQIGTNTDCRGGRSRTFAWFEILPRDRFEQELRLEVRAGDRIAASIAVVGRAYHMVLENLTTGEVEDTLQRSDSARRLTAEWVVEAPTIDCPSDCQVALLASFGTIAFTGARAVLAGVTGPIGDGRWTRVRLDLESRSGLVKAKPGSLGRDGASFTVVWRHR